MAEAKTDQLRKLINKKLDNWNEVSNFTIKGVKNLSRSDMDVLLMCCNLYDRCGTLRLLHLSQEIKTVLKAFGLYED